MKNLSDNTYFLIFGFGYTAQFLARDLTPLNVRVIGTTRNKNTLLNQSQLTYELIDFYGSEVAKHLSHATHLLISIPPIEGVGDPVLANFKDLLIKNALHLKWLGYLSSTGVYGDHQGHWVHENSACLSPGVQGQLRLNAETSWMTFAKDYQLPLHVFRLSGIYGPGRNALERLIAGKKASIYKEGQFFSRIHVADIASVLLASMRHPNPYSIYNVTDDEPASAYQVDAYAASLLNQPPLPLINYEQASLSPMEQHFYTSNRRVLNFKMKEELQVKLLYPTYRHGLKQIFNEDYDSESLTKND